MSFVERFVILCPCLGESTIRGLTARPCTCSLPATLSTAALWPGLVVSAEAILHATQYCAQCPRQSHLTYIRSIIVDCALLLNLMMKLIK